jgi:predicted nuclease with TOPRIM domain
MAAGAGEPIMMVFMKTMSADMSIIKNSLVNLRETVDVVRTEIREINQKLHDVTDELEAVKSEQKKTKEQIAKMSTVLKDLKAENLQLKFEANRLNQNDARFKITNHGIADDSNDLQAVCNIAGLLEVGLSPIQIADMYRINTRAKGKPRPLVVKFINRTTRDALIAHRRKKSIYSTDIEIKSDKNQIFLNEYLTREAM